MVHMFRPSVPPLCWDVGVSPPQGIPLVSCDGIHFALGGDGVGGGTQQQAGFYVLAGGMGSNFLQLSSFFLQRLFPASNPLPPSTSYTYFPVAQSPKGGRTMMYFWLLEVQKMDQEMGDIGLGCQNGLPASNFGQTHYFLHNQQFLGHFLQFRVSGTQLVPIGGLTHEGGWGS